MSDVKLPVVGPVNKKWLVVFVVTGGAVGLYVLHKRSAAAASSTTAATADTSGTGDYGTTGMDSGYDPNAIDPATGLTYAEEDAGGYIDPNTGNYVYPGSTTAPTTAAAATNAEWSQQVESELSGVVDPTALAAAIGKYLTGQALTSDQQSLVDQAIAFGGYPPVAGSNGYPPNMQTSPVAGGSPGGTGTGSGGTTKKEQAVRQVATGAESLDAVAKARRTTASHIISVTEAPGAGINSANLSKFKAYVAKGTGTKMPRGLVYYTTNS